MNAPTEPRLPLLDLDLLRTMVAITEAGNFSAAADVLGRTPSAISMQVKKIEDLLGRPVFIRDSRAVTPTRDGEFLVEHGRRLLALNREVVARFVTPDLQGEVRMGAPDDAAERLLPPMLRRFADTHPCVTVNVIVEGSARMVDMVRKGQLDLAMITCDAGIDRVDEIEVLMREQLVWAALAGGVAAEQDPLPVSVWEECCVWRKAGLEGLEAQNRAYRIAFQSAHISGQRAAILADLAVAPIPVSGLGGQIVEARPKCGLPPLPDYGLGLVVGDNVSPPVCAAADHLRASFARQ
ncbi:MAG: LysR family transcriptional regulator [Rhodobacteraceae bacterium]|nr:LysR family transcriptional regulator [Paracoccaceae bacterium]